MRTVSFLHDASVFRLSRLVDMIVLSALALREISPTHFPGIDGSYETFQKLPRSERHECCEGTPPPLLERNVVRDKERALFLCFFSRRRALVRPQDGYFDFYVILEAGS